jgi:uncharacterized protein with GYD domain
MAKFFMYGNYSQDALKGISAQRTKKALGLIKHAGGKVISMYALLGKYDLVLITDFPEVKDVVKASIALHKLTGIAFTSFPAITIEQFDSMKA